jgi:pimeloyl-ACP methyl ester carboxylesterase
VIAHDVRIGYSVYAVGEYQIRFLMPALVAAGYRVATMDLRGQGQSSASWPSYSAAAVSSDILALIEHLGAGPAIVIGTSVASAAAIWAAVEAPPLIDGLVLISSFAQAAPPWKIRLMTSLLLNPLWGQALYARYFPMMYPSVRPADFDAHLAQVRSMLGEPGRLRALLGYLERL